MPLTEDSFELKGLDATFRTGVLMLRFPQTVTDGHYTLLVGELEQFLHGPYGGLDWEIDLSALHELHLLLAEAILTVGRTLRQRGQRLAIVGIRGPLDAADEIAILREFIRAN